MDIGKLVRGAFTALFTVGLNLISPSTALAQDTHQSELEKETISLYAGPDSADMMIVSSHSIYSDSDPSTLIGISRSRIRAEDFDNDGDVDLTVVSKEEYTPGVGTVIQTINFYRGDDFRNYELGTIQQFRKGCRLEDGRIEVWITQDEEGHNVYAMDVVEQRDLYNLQAVSESGVSISGYEFMIKRLIADEKEADREAKTNTASPGFLLTGRNSNQTVDRLAALGNMDVGDYAIGTIQQDPYRCNGGLLPGYTNITGIYEDLEFSIVHNTFETLDGIAEEFRTFAELEESGRIQDKYLTNGEAVFASGFPINEHVKYEWEDEIEDALQMIDPETFPGVWTTTFLEAKDVQPNS